MFAGEVEPAAERHRDGKDEQLCRYEPQPRGPQPAADRWPAEEDGQAHQPDHRNRGIEVQNLLGKFLQDLERLSLRLLAEHHRKLLEADDEADGGEHAVDNRCWKKLAQRPGPEQAEGHLHHPRHTAHCDRHPIGAEVGLGIGASRESERLHRPEHDHDHAGGRPLDGEF